MTLHSHANHPRPQQRCYRCGGSEDVYAPITAQGTRQPALCGKCVQFIRKHDRVPASV